MDKFNRVRNASLLILLVILNFIIFNNCEDNDRSESQSFEVINCVKDEIDSINHKITEIKYVRSLEKEIIKKNYLVDTSRNGYKRLFENISKIDVDTFNVYVKISPYMLSRGFECFKEKSNNRKIKSKIDNLIKAGDLAEIKIISSIIDEIPETEFEKIDTRWIFLLILIINFQFIVNK